MSLSIDMSKYLTSYVMDAKYGLDLFLDFICFNASTIFNPMEGEKGVIEDVEIVKPSKLTACVGELLIDPLKVLKE